MSSAPLRVQLSAVRAVEVESATFEPENADIFGGEEESACVASENERSSKAAWHEIAVSELPLWNTLLLDTEASIYQYPFWNEPQRSFCLTPRYLVWESEQQLQAYVCIVTVGFSLARIGLVFRGPVLLAGQKELPQEAAVQLLAWARSQKYKFLRFTHSSAEIVQSVASAGDARDLDAFPYFLDYPVLSPDYVVEQHETEEDTLASFDREARRKIRRATEIGYEFRCSDSPQALAGLWPIYQECSRRKKFRLERPLSVYMQAMRLARPTSCARVFAVYLGGNAVGSALVVRDRDTAHCMLAAFAPAHRHAAAFLHWHCMRYMFARGVKRYNFGPGPGSLARFKRQFTPPGPGYPSAVTLVLKRGWFRFWMTALFPLAKLMRPVLRSAWPTLTMRPKREPGFASDVWQTVRHSRA